MPGFSSSQVQSPNVLKKTDGADKIGYAADVTLRTKIESFDFDSESDVRGMTNAVAAGLENKTVFTRWHNSTTKMGAAGYRIISNATRAAESLAPDDTNVFEVGSGALFYAVRINTQKASCYEKGYLNDAALSAYKTNLYECIADDYVSGQEYLWLVTKIAELNRTSYVSLDTVFSGDSTTFGVNSAGHEINVQFQEYARNLGFGYCNAFNEGHSGARTPEWGSVGGFVHDDIANYPDMRLYVARWGINDGSAQTVDGTKTTLDNYETALRYGLAQLRAFKNVENLSIVLMTPNCISEDGNRNERWNELLGAIVRKAARDYQCTFIDTYAIFRDARREGIGSWLDDAGAGQGIHPDKYFTSQIAGVLAHVVFSPIRYWASNKLQMIPGGAGAAPASNAPYQYPQGVSYFRATVAAGWDFEGMVVTEQHTDRITRQTLIGHNSDYNQREQVRYALNLTTWGAWRKKNDISLLNGWVLRGGSVTPRYQKTAEGLVHFEAELDGSSKSANTIFNLPVGHRPSTNQRHPYYDNNGAVAGVVQIGSDGNIIWVSGTLGEVNLNVTIFSYQ
jgi:hypothetical protein